MEIPRAVRESCFLLRDVAQDNQMFERHCSSGLPGAGHAVYIEINTWVHVLKELEILGDEHPITSPSIRSLMLPWLIHAHVHTCIHAHSGVIHILELVIIAMILSAMTGAGQHQVTRDVAQRIFARFGGRWAKNITADLFVRY